MGTLTREDIINALALKIGESTNPREVFGYSISADHPSLSQTRATLSSYSTELLIELHMSANETNEDDRNANYMFAHHGKSEQWVRIWIFLRGENKEVLFGGDRHNHVCTGDSAINSLELYPELSYEDTDEYFQKVLALTGVVTSIQYDLHRSEGYYYNYTEGANPRLLEYSIDPHDDEGIDKIMRISSRDLTALILSRPDDWEKIAKIVTERETDDAEFIRSVLDGSKIFTIADGTL